MGNVQNPIVDRTPIESPTLFIRRIDRNEGRIQESWMEKFSNDNYLFETLKRIMEVNNCQE